MVIQSFPPISDKNPGPYCSLDRTRRELIPPKYTNNALVQQKAATEKEISDLNPLRIRKIKYFRGAMKQHRNLDPA